MAGNVLNIKACSPLKQRSGLTGTLSEIRPDDMYQPFKTMTLNMINVLILTKRILIGLAMKSNTCFTTNDCQSRVTSRTSAL